MGNSSSLSKSIKASITFALSILVWILLAPPELGGSTRYAMVIGKSMLPTLHSGDLVLLHSSQAYQVGEIIGFLDPNIHAIIVHRIISSANGQYITKGDNNRDPDVYSSTNPDILGKVWFRAPLLGNLIAAIRQPLFFTLVVGIMVLFIILTFSQSKNPPQIKNEMRLKTTNPLKSTNGVETSAYNNSKLMEFLIVVLVVIFVLCLGFLIWSFSKSVYEKAAPIPYIQTGDFSYTASAESGIYDSDAAKTGDPIFTQLTCILNVSYSYTITGEGLEGVIGTYQTYVKVYDKKSGWTKTIPVSAATGFSGNNLTTTSSIDLCQIRSMIDTTEEKTGLKLGSYSMDIVAAVEINGLLQGNRLHDYMVSKLEFVFEHLNLYVSPTNSETGPFSMIEKGALESEELNFSTIELFGLPMKVQTSRLLSVALLVLSGTFLGVLLFGMINLMNSDIDKKIELQFGALVIDSSDFILKIAPVIEFDTIDELAKLAIYNHTVILRTRKSDMVFYTVRVGDISYRFISSRK
jgi:signal peptidase